MSLASESVPRNSEYLQIDCWMYSGEPWMGHMGTRSISIVLSDISSFAYKSGNVPTMTNTVLVLFRLSKIGNDIIICASFYSVCRAKQTEVTEAPSTLTGNSALEGALRDESRREEAIAATVTKDAASAGTGPG